MQEGHHVGLDEQGKAQRVGIVYNEMKGSYSSHESLLVEHSFRALFPGDPLSRDSGGDPGYIPDLTYEQFVDFHKKHYHPSNCRIFLYGDIPVQKSLDFLDKHFLSRFESAEPPLPNREIIPWNKPEIMEFPAPKGESDGCSHSVNWLLSPAWQPEERVALQ
jgi:Zn-dependent M16 (insulinase) family peptidase